MGTFESAPNSVDILAEDTEKGATQRDKFPSRLDRYGKAKSKALAISEYIKTEHSEHNKLALELSSCGEYLVFRDYYTIGEIRLSKACFCKKHLLCPLCAIRRGSKMLSRHIDRYHEVIAANGRLKAYMVTLTVKDGEDLKERFTHLQKSVRYLHKKRHLKNRKSEVQKATGAVWSYEIKRGKNSGLWHPHCHSIWLCDSEPVQAELSSEWQRITKDSFIVDVREITPNDPVKGFLEVFKYAVKFSDQPEKDTMHCYFTLKGKRLIASFGDFYGVPEPDNLTDDPLEGLPYIDHFYQFISGFYQLKK